MPASITSDESGSRPYVIGSRIAMVGIGPIPGNTPIRVPSTHPTSANHRFCSVPAAPKPVARLAKTSMGLFPPPGRQGLSKPIDKDQDASDRQPDTQGHRLEQIEITAGKGGDQCHQHTGDGEPDVDNQVNKKDDRYEDKNYREQQRHLEHLSFNR